MDEEFDITYHCLRFENDVGENEVEGISRLDVAMYPTTGICKVNSGLLVAMNYHPEHSPNNDRIILEHTYLVQASLVKTTVDIMHNKINTRIIYIPEYQTNHLIDCFREVYRSQGELTVLKGDSGEPRWPPNIE
jgi:hypothetical protein